LTLVKNHDFFGIFVYGYRTAVIAYAKRQLNSPRKPTKKKAEAFLKKFLHG